MFKESLEFGQIGESVIARWLRSRGHCVLPVYEVELSHGKGPRLFLPDSLAVAPDMLVFRGADAYWVEAKHKTGFAWNRLRGIWTTGIDRHHYREYCRIDDATPWPVWLMFLQRGGPTKDGPEASPAGLYGETLQKLRRRVNHESDKGGGPSGMVYWSKDDLRKIADLEQVLDLSVY